MKYISSKKKPLPSKVLVSAFSLATGALVSSPSFADDENRVILDTIVLNADANQEPSYYIKSSKNSKITTPLLDAPRSIHIISKQEIDERGSSSLQDVLRTTPGITLGSGEGGTPMGDRPFIRGYEASTDILIDGVRDYARGSHDIFNLEAVEISKGPGSVYSGRGSTGGTINLITKKPKDKNESEITTEYQNSGTGQAKYRFTTDNNVLLTENIAFRLNAMLDQGDVARRDQVEVDRWGVSPSITFGLNTPTRLTAGYSYLDFSDTPDMGVPFSNAKNPNRKKPIESMPFNTNFGRPDIDFRNYNSEIFHLNLEHDFNENLKVKFAAKDLKTTQDYFFTRLSFGCAASSGNACATEGAGLSYERNDRSSYRTSHVNNGQLDLQAKFNTGLIKHNVITGIDYSKERIGTKDMTVTGAGKEVVDFYNPTNSRHPNFNIQYGPEKKAGEITNTGLYVFDTISLNNKLDVNLGLRFDDFESTNFKDTVSESMFNYQAGIVYKLAPFGRIYTNYATSSNPSGDNLGQAGGADGVASGNRLGDNIGPEKTRSIEIGTKWEFFNEQLAFNAALFETKKTNARSTDAEGIVAIDGKNRVRGGEMSVSGKINPSWDISAGYTYLDSKLLDGGFVKQADQYIENPDNGNQLKFIAKHSANIWTTYAMNSKLRLGAGATYVGKRFVDDSNDYYLPQHIRYDAFASYQLLPEFGLQFNINNISNERIYDASHVGVFSTVAPGRSFALKGTYRF
ncbi:TonB-dependent siderophore receptor [Acinetobacter rudis]|uniref:TonB-dependent receptor n=1 Tax=Acinetobacter rudis TaxID=632955 RepID=UPI00280D653A|nr:TonB-dependent siderophore receptor [Acinetobacter rudis]MDQ8952229.1 TonB-dependent siderophore receptor [Acinetobacter rudis]